MYRPFAGPVATENHDYPSIDDFLDELPPIESFLATDPEIVEVESPVEAATDDEWLNAGWNSYDATALTVIAQRTPSKPVRAFEPPRSQELPASLSSPGPSAEEVAAALDGIARSIRSGELVIDNLNGMKPEAAMAAAIAAILRMRG